MLRQQELAISATIPRGACTNVAVVSLMARCTVVAGVVFAPVYRGAAVATSVSRWTSARIAICSLLACSTILARVCRALIAHVVTIHSREAIRTLAQVGIDEIHAARILEDRSDMTFKIGPWLVIQEQAQDVQIGDSPLEQGLEEQWSIFFSQLNPAYPMGHWQK